MYPFQYVDVSVPAQWIRPTGWLEPAPTFKFEPTRPLS